VAAILLVSVNGFSSFSSLKGRQPRYGSALVQVSTSQSQAVSRKSTLQATTVVSSDSALFNHSSPKPLGKIAATLAKVRRDDEKEDIHSFNQSLSRLYVYKNLTLIKTS
jgi:hypothetical protein